MAEGEHSLPADEDLFGQLLEPAEQLIAPAEQMSQPIVQQPSNQERDNDEVLQQVQEPQETSIENAPTSSEPTVVQEDSMSVSEPQDILEPSFQPSEPQEQQEYYETRTTTVPRGSLFQPAAYIPEQQNEDQANANIDGNDSNNVRSDVSNMPSDEPNENTVWIDSDSENDTEEFILRENFYLPYSDHNYDVPDPEDRVIHPQEGPFPIIDGIDENGCIRKQWMPDRYTAGRPVTPQTPPSEVRTAEHLQIPHPAQTRMNQLSRPMVASQPFSIGGTQVEYSERVAARGPQMTRGDHPSQFRILNDYPSLAPTRNVAGQPRVAAAAIIRGGPRIEQPYQSPQHQNQAVIGVRNAQMLQRRGPLQHGAASTPGSYQHISNPTPAGARRPVQQQRIPGTSFVISGGGATSRTRPVHITRPMDIHEREFVEHPHPIPTQPAILSHRRIADVAPHRMTHEQRQEQQQLNRQRPAAQFPSGAASRGPIERVIVRGPPGTVGQQVAPMGRGRPMSGSSQDEILRSPQRVLPEQHQPVCEPPRRFQLKVTDTYSTPVPKASDALPAQITEDPPETQPQETQEPTTSTQEPEPAAAAGSQTSSMPLAAAPESASPSRLSRTSPIKSHGMQKPTPPHRMTQEEKKARLMQIADKDKPTQLTIPNSSQQPMGHRVHQDDTLAVVQSVFESKGLQPDTPKDKEAISKLADFLRSSADEFTTHKSGSDTGRQRTLSSGPSRHPQYPMHTQHPQHPIHHQHHSQHQSPLSPDQMMGDDGRRKRTSSSGRYDSTPLQTSQLMRQQHQMQQQLPHIQNQNDMDLPHRPRGRPRGSTGPQRSRYPSGSEAPIAPHRTPAGARTLPPRPLDAPQLPAARNGATKNSDSESDGVGDGERSGDGEESWEMRCHCGMTHGTGDCVECEVCTKWQHMACMSLTPSSDVRKYKCELCAPRRLRISKPEAIRKQKEILAELEAQAKKARRKSDTAEKKKSQAAARQTSRRSAPMPLQQHPQPPPAPRLVQLNDYSKQAAALLAAMDQTAGADTLLEESRGHKRARRMFVDENIEALVTIENVAIRQVILEVNGHVSMSHEVKRQPGGGNNVFMYDGLMKGTSGEDVGVGSELVCIDTKRKGNDTKLTRRSCVPNCVLKHVLGSNATLGIMVVATKDILRNQEVTLPFDADWKDCDVELECAEHIKEMHFCPFEQERSRFAAERARIKNEAKREAEEVKRAEEEKRRMEDEVRKERARKIKEIEKQAEQERLQREKEERKTKEHEKAGTEKKEEGKSKVDDNQSGSSAQTGRESSEKLISREERHIQQAEELFRRQEEAQKRKDAAKIKAAEKAERLKSATPVPESTNTPKRQSERQSKAKDVPSTSDVTPSASNSSTRRSAKRAESVAKAASPTPSTSSKRVRSSTVNLRATQASSSSKRSATADLSPTPPVSSKRVRSSTVNLRATQASSSSKRSATADTTTPGPPPKKGKVMTTVKDLLKTIHENAEKVALMPREEFTLPFHGEVSSWVRELKDVDRKEESKKDTTERKMKSERRKKIDPETAKKDAKLLEEKQKKHEEHLRASRKRIRDKRDQQHAEERRRLAAESEKLEASDEPQRGDSEETVASVELGEEAQRKQEEEVDGIEREASEESSGKDDNDKASKGEKGGPKSISFAEYNMRRSRKMGEGSSEVSAAPRTGFIPSTEGSSLANVELSVIPLEDEPSISAPTGKTIAPTGVAVAAVGTNTVTTVTSPSTRSRTRAGASESANDHSIPLRHRAQMVFDLMPGATGVSNEATSSTSARRPPRSSRWD